MKTVVIAGAHRLATAAAGSYARMRKAGMPAGGINSSYRDTALQRRIFLDRYKPQASGAGPFGDVRWYKGVRYVRISAKGMVAVPGTSVHETGLALDMATASAAHAWMLKHAGAHGWRRTISSEPWHWEYRAANDKHKNKTTSGGIDVAKLPIVRPGARSVAAGRVQGLLLANGYSVGRHGVDKVFGKSSESALKKFQKDHKLTPDGICGAKTWPKLLGI